MFSNFDEVLQAALNGAEDVETAKIQDEAALFRKRGWERYITFAVNLMSDFYVDGGGSVFDSYLISRAVNGSEANQKLLKSDKARSILYNDTLRLNMEVYCMKPVLQNKLMELDSVLKENIEMFGLSYREEIITPPYTSAYDRGTQYFIVSKKVISDAEMDVIRNESKAPSEESDDILRDFFIIRIHVTESGI